MGESGSEQVVEAVGQQVKTRYSLFSIKNQARRYSMDDGNKYLKTKEKKEFLASQQVINSNNLKKQNQFNRQSSQKSNSQQSEERGYAETMALKELMRQHSPSKRSNRQHFLKELPHEGNEEFISFFKNSPTKYYNQSKNLKPDLRIPIPRQQYVDKPPPNYQTYGRTPAEQNNHIQARIRNIRSCSLPKLGNNVNYGSNVLHRPEVRPTQVSQIREIIGKDLRHKYSDEAQLAQMQMARSLSKKRSKSPVLVQKNLEIQFYELYENMSKYDNVIQHLAITRANYGWRPRVWTLGK